VLTVPPEVISAFILKEMKSIAEKNLGEKVTDVVITVPAYFDNAMRSATRTAAEMIGLKVIRLINEPTAAAFAYAAKLPNDAAGNILVFDLGGGTFDVTVLSFDCEEKTYKVNCTSGDLHLGGRDWDAELETYVFSQIKKQGGSFDSENKLFTLREKIVKAKERLSYEESVKIEFTDDVEIEITRKKFEKIAGKLWKRCIDVVDALLTENKIKKGELDEIILVGGSTRMPKITAMLKEYFGEQKRVTVHDPDEVVAHGAAIYAYSLLNKDKESISVSDVGAHDIGIAVMGKEMFPLIKRNTSLPANGSGHFTPYVPFAPVAMVQVYQGNYKLVERNHPIGKLKVTGYEVGHSVTLQITVNVNEEALLTLNCTLPDQPAKSYSLQRSLLGSHIMTDEEVKDWKNQIPSLTKK